MNVLKYLNVKPEPTDTGTDIRAGLLSRAEEARSRGNFVASALLFEHIAEMESNPASALHQSARMYIEATDFTRAEQLLLRVAQAEPHNAEAYLDLAQLSFHQSRLDEAEFFYERALALRPEWHEAKAGLLRVGETRTEQLRRERLARKETALSFAQYEEKENLLGSRDKRVDPSLFKKGWNELHHDHGPAFVFTHSGNNAKTEWGNGATLRGIEALRGYLVSDVPMASLRIYMDGDVIHDAPLIEAPQRFERSNPNIRKWAYNAWIDFTNLPRGWHEFIFCAFGADGEAHEGRTWRREHMIVADPLPAGFATESDTVVPPFEPGTPGSLVEQINARPSIVHKASPHSFPGKIDTVAVLRSDQLGDTAVSAAAFLHLRQILPDARLVGLMSAASAELSRSYGVFDEIIELDFPEDQAQRQRVMDFDVQEALIDRLKPYKFDVAIDFVVNGTSKRLVAMTGAPVTMGFGNDDSKTFAMDIVTNDPLSNNDITHHSVRMMMLVKSLELWMKSDTRIVRREDLRREDLAAFGIAPNERYVLIHSGSRITFTRWQHYVALAKQVIAELGVKVVFMADDDSVRDQFAEEEGAGRLIYLARKLPFDQFDALISFASVFVGNDSGPKHLAALRGAPVVSLHSSRISWIEWGQEQTGVVISRQVPCAGCGLHHDPEECAQDVACMKYIRLAEVFREVRALFEAGAPNDQVVAAISPA